MRKSVIALVAILVAAALALTYVFVINNPERQIVGIWTQKSGSISFNFSKDGKVKIPVEFFVSSLEADINGTYKIDKKANTITFTFSAFSLEYNKTYNFKIKGNTLTLTNTSSGTSSEFTKQASS
jgi:hypothetical protein